MACGGATTGESSSSSIKRRRTVDPLLVGVGGFGEVVFDAGGFGGARKTWLAGDCDEVDELANFAKALCIGDVVFVVGETEMDDLGGVVEEVWVCAASSCG